MIIVIAAGTLAGFNTAWAILQSITTSNLVWLWLLGLNIPFYFMFLWGKSILERREW